MESDRAWPELEFPLNHIASILGQPEEIARPHKSQDLPVAVFLMTRNPHDSFPNGIQEMRIIMAFASKRECRMRIQTARMGIGCILCNF